MAAINQSKQLGIADGTSATTYDPAANTLCWHMALFLTRTLAVDGVTQPTDGFIVTNVAGSGVTYADTSLGEAVTVTVTTSDTFTVDGQATRSCMDAGDLLSLGGTVDYNLTNRVAADYASGVVDDVTGGLSFDIIGPITGTILRNDSSTNGTFPAVHGGWRERLRHRVNNSLNPGDTVSPAAFQLHLNPR